MYRLETKPAGRGKYLLPISGIAIKDQILESFFFFFAAIFRYQKLPRTWLSEAFVPNYSKCTSMPAYLLANGVPERECHFGERGSGTPRSFDVIIVSFIE